MSGAVRPDWAPGMRAGLCQMLRDQLVETIDAIRSQAEVVPLPLGPETVGERPIQVGRLLKKDPVGETLGPTGAVRNRAERSASVAGGWGDLPSSGGPWHTRWTTSQGG
ncbi:hypothetical protein O3S80_10620 [Streptomyces sp. Lzd4kr]|nr:hypothetical protein [Streptomyces sp. Lzd4kr]